MAHALTILEPIWLAHALKLIKNSLFTFTDDIICTCTTMYKCSLMSQAWLYLQFYMYIVRSLKIIY